MELTAHSDFFLFFYFLMWLTIGEGTQMEQKWVGLTAPSMAVSDSPTPII